MLKEHLLIKFGAVSLEGDILPVHRSLLKSSTPKETAQRWGEDRLSPHAQKGHQTGCCKTSG